MSARSQGGCEVRPVRGHTIVERDAGHECEETQRHPLPAAITQTIIIPRHRYGPARFVATETSDLIKGDDDDDAAAAAVVVDIRLSESPCLFH